MRILLLDIETAPKLAHVWRTWKENISINQLVSDTYVLNWAAKWAEDDYLYSDALCWHPEYKEDPANDLPILENLWELLDEADVIVAHNGDNFDIPTLNSRFLFHGIEPPSSFRTVDTLKVARRKFKLTSNKLEFLARHLGVGGKLDTGGFELWSRIVMNKDPKAWRTMIEYCEHDLLLLEDVYLALRPWDDKGPARVYLDKEKPTCNACGSKRVVKNGSYATNTQVYQKFKCQKCGHNMRSRYAEPLDKQAKQSVLRSL